MGNKQKALLPPEEEHSICAATGFTTKQLHRLHARFCELAKQDPTHQYLTREDLLEIDKVSKNPLGKRLVDVIVEDYGEADKINFRQFTTILARFRRGKSDSNINGKDNKLLFLFSIYDRNHDKKIDRDELLEILKMMVGGNILYEQIATIVSHTIEELDSDGDSTITFEEFCKTLSKIDIDEKMSMKFLS